MTATMNEHLPEDMILQILYRLPVKPLIRFSCVSKRWSSIISDPQFAKSHFKLSCERKTPSRRLLLSTPSGSESLDVQTASFSSVRKVACPFKQPGRAFNILGSCNGMLFVALDLHDSFYIWNPSTGLFRKLPNPGFASIGATTFNPSTRPLDPSKAVVCLHHCGFGYVSASDDYKLVVAAEMMNSAVHLEIFSSRADSWKRIESPPAHPLIGDFSRTRGSLTNEALHWLHILLDTRVRNAVTAFDLGKEEFRQIALPLLGGETEFYRDVGVVFEGCLCVSSYERRGDGVEYVQLWVMMEYDVPESWAKLFKFEMFNDHDCLRRVPIFYTDRGIIIWRSKREKCKTVDELSRFDHEEEDKLDKVAVCTGRYTLEMDRLSHYRMIDYDESLVWVHH
ncbi:hypothetical protein M0R45_004804 [Rubus argutus]|uniref:F-box domain-containing protein n=1 Tax=Rubus argutus TaxID=59490 RepID=A0AAW1YKZ0_RUBAR